MRQEFVMNEEQYQRIMDASKAVPYIVVGGHEPASPQENANRAWAALGEEMGFDWNTVQPSGPDNHVFTAEAKEFGMLASTFKEEETVWYIPLHVRKDKKMPEELPVLKQHKDSKTGKVIGTNDAARIVFVMFGADTQATACSPEDLFYDAPPAKAESGAPAGNPAAPQAAASTATPAVGATSVQAAATTTAAAGPAAGKP